MEDDVLQILPRDYFYSNDTVFLAKSLLGKYLVRDFVNYKKEFLITEVEAYSGFDDKASHACCGKTARNSVMFEKGGLWYVYLCYGMHWMLNLVTGDKDFPAAILIRGLQGINGPGRITKNLEIDKKFNGEAINISSDLYLVDKGSTLGKIEASPRIGVDYALDDALLPWRFVLKNF